MKHWTIDIDNEGNIKIEGHGFKGKGCTALNDLAKHLGTVTASENKLEYYASCPVPIKQGAGGGGG